MESLDANGVKVYNLSAGRLFPNWLTDSQKKKLSKDEEYRKRIDLIQDFQMNSACERIKVSADGKYIVLTGVYPPILRTFEVSQLSMKFERHLTSEIVQFQLLTDDYSKMAILEADRTLEFHAAYGFHFKTRIPKFGRDMTYFKENCELLISGSTSEVYRFSCEQGQFYQPFETESFGNNAIGISPIHQLVGIAGENGVLECWDERQKQRVSSLNVSNDGLTAVRFSSDGLNVALGTSKGLMVFYDLRMSEPLFTKQYQYETPIMDLKFTQNNTLIGCDQKVIKLWNHKTQEHICTVETPSQINDIAIIPKTGLLFAACEQDRAVSYYIPSLGPAPSWCSFIDSITEELEEEESSTYVDYKFVTRDELENWNLTHLIGTTLLRAYMHGFFMDYKLYNKLVAIADPDAYDKWKKQEIIRREEKKKEQRIVLKHKLPKVNRELAEKLISEKKGGEVDNPIGDDRFSTLFTRDEFAIDASSDDYKRRHAVDKKNASKVDEDDEELKEQFELLEELQNEDKIKPTELDEDADNSDDEKTDSSEDKEPVKSKEKRKLYKLKDGESTSIVPVNKTEKMELANKRKLIQNTPLEERMSEVKEDQSVSKFQKGRRETTFFSKTAKTYKPRPKDTY